MPDNEPLIIAVKSSPVKKPEETGAALPVKDLLVGIPKRTYVELTCLVTCQVVPYVKYNLNYFRFNGTHVEDRRNPTALATTFEFLSNDVTIFESYRNSTCRQKQKHCSTRL